MVRNSEFDSLTQQPAEAARSCSAVTVKAVKMKTMCKRCKGWGRVKEINPVNGVERTIKCPACKGSGKAENYSFPDGKKIS
jgi:DnaJ-class molecular chaperone